MYGPQTREEAKKVRYGEWSGNPKGSAYQADKCAAEVGNMPHFHQCSRAAGFGPEHLYCKQHAKMFREDV